MKKRQYKKSWIENLFNGITKLLVSVVVLVSVTFILVSGSIQLSVSFNKDKSSPTSILEKAGQAIHLVKVGYGAVSGVLE